MKISDLQAFNYQNTYSPSTSLKIDKAAPVSTVKPVEKTPADFRSVVDTFDLQPKASTLYKRDAGSSRINTSLHTKPLEDFSLPSSDSVSNVQVTSSSLKVSDNVDMSSSKIIISDEVMDGFLKNAFKVFDLQN